MSLLSRLTAVALLPVAIAAVTTTPDWLTALLDASWSCRTGCGANAAPVWADVDGWVVTASFVAEPAVMLTLPEVTDVNDGAVNRNVLVPTVPVIERFVNVATPEASDVAVVVPPSVPPPLKIAAVTTTPETGTGLPEPSRS